MIKLILDSVILIDHLNNVKKATDFMQGLDLGETAISVITRAEVLCGIDDAAFEDVSMLLDQYLSGVKAEQFPNHNVIFYPLL